VHTVNNTTMFIYKITNTTNGKAYIGLTTKGVHSRWKAHISSAFAKNVPYYLYRAMRKYGLSAFKVETLYEAVDLRELVAVEKGLIAQYGTLYGSHGYNQSSGGEGRSGVKLSDTIKAKMSAAAKDRFLRLDHPMKGKKHSLESRTKMSCSAKKKPAVTAVTRTKLSAAAMGRIISRDAVERSRQKRTGAKRTPEQIERIRAGRRAVNPKKGRGNSKYPAEFIMNAVARVRAGEKQGRVAMSLGIDQGYMSQLMSGKRGSSLQQENAQ